MIITLNGSKYVDSTKKQGTVFLPSTIRQTNILSRRRAVPKAYWVRQDGISFYSILL